ncbi:MAG: tetratricopeptide repeat protein [Herminiimonas sp.]|nr:tetratricopeptide repeat protein [Herminiimonas sp.]
MTPTSLDYFASLVREDTSILLFEAALSLGLDVEPVLDLSAPQMELDTLALKLRQRLPSDAPSMQKLRMLNHFFYQELGFCGNVNDYYHPDNSYLHRVISTRRGIPISLAMVYIELAQQIGLQIRGISFPGHFLMKLSMQSGDVILDPFNGSSLSREELEERLEPFVAPRPDGVEPTLGAYLQPAPARDILVRMLGNLKAVFMEQNDWRRLLAVHERLVILLPNDIGERRDRGLAYERLQCPQAALQDLEWYLAQKPYAADADTLRRKLPALRNAAKRLN